MFHHSFQTFYELHLHKNLHIVFHMNNLNPKKLDFHKNIDETSKITTQETTQEKILNLINKNPSITQTQIANALGLTRDGISYNIKQLKDKGIIKKKK